MGNPDFYDTLTCNGNGEHNPYEKGVQQGNEEFISLPCDLLDSAVIPGQPKPPAATDFIDLEFASQYIDNLDGLFDPYTSVTYIDLSYNLITYIAAATFPHNDVLRSLNLQSNYITSIQANAFAQMTKLQTLVLDNNNIESITPAMFFTFVPATKLQVFLQDNPITQVYSDTLHYLDWGVHYGTVYQSEFVLGAFFCDTTVNPGFPKQPAPCINNNDCFDNCGPGVYCLVEGGGYLNKMSTFACPPTTTRAPITCVGNDCGINSTCTPHEQGYKCTCNSGYLSKNIPRNGKYCQPIDLCARTHKTCGAHSTCTFLGPRQVKCSCNTGYSSLTGDGRNCVIENTCDIDNGHCGADSTCTQIQFGQVTCRCNEGYHSVWNDADGSFHRDGRNCKAINHCKFIHTGCGYNSECHYDGPGKFHCTCWEGFEAHTSAKGVVSCRPLYGQDLPNSRSGLPHERFGSSANALPAANPDVL